MYVCVLWESEWENSKSFTTCTKICFRQKWRLCGNSNRKYSVYTVLKPDCIMMRPWQSQADISVRLWIGEESCAGSGLVHEQHTVMKTVEQFRSQTLLNSYLNQTCDANASLPMCICIWLDFFFFLTLEPTKWENCCHDGFCRVCLLVAN